MKNQTIKHMIINDFCFKKTKQKNQKHSKMPNKITNITSIGV